MTLTSATIQEFADGKMLAEIRGSVGYMTFNQPEKRNAVSLEMWNGVADILERFEADDNVRVVVVTGAGGKAFVSGADISQFDKQRSNAEARAEYERKSGVGRNRLNTFAKPLIAQINGFCIGGGLAIAMRCDLRIASANSSFGIPAARLGIAYSPDSVEMLINLIGPARARMMLYSAERIDAAEAERIGLINRSVSEPELETVVATLADTISSNAPLSVAASRLAITELAKPAGERDVDAIMAAVARCYDSEDYREGRAAFKEKRAPVFKGR
jgi:enoyl-CoA hydratase/carnithine racemase